MLKEVREAFAGLEKGRIIKISAEGSGFDAWALRQLDGYGVAMRYEGPPLEEHFTNVVIYSDRFEVSNTVESLLVLKCSIESLRAEFATIAAQFLEPGIDGANREEVLKDPLDWWSRWSILLGNAFVNHTPYAVVAEMAVLEHLWFAGESPVWQGPHAGSYDIETLFQAVEVKSTLSKYSAVVQVSSQFQLRSPNVKIGLYFCRMEKSSLGKSVGDMFTRLLEIGYDEVQLRKGLKSLGIHEGSRAWGEKYLVLEKRRYDVDARFPVISSESFKDGQIPMGIIKILYDVDLDSLSHTAWE